MSINTGHAQGGVLIFSGECILLYVDCVELKFEGTDDQYLRGGCRSGRLYLTTHRMIFTNRNACDVLQSFTFPFFRLSCIELEQPIFGCNHIKGQVRSIPQQDMHMDQWNGTACFKLFFKSGGACEFGMALLQAAKMAAQHAVNNPPPPYVAPIEPFHPAPQCVYSPPPGSFGMVLPTHLFPGQPPCNSVFMTEQPPPYPGLNTTTNCYPAHHAHGGRWVLKNGQWCICDPGYFNNACSFPCSPDGCYFFSQSPYPCCVPATGMPCCNPPGPAYPTPCPCPRICAGADAKAQEAAASAPQPAYYDPNNPHYTYLPQPPPPYNQPPSYDEATKKSQ